MIVLLFVQLSMINWWKLFTRARTDEQRIHLCVHRLIPHSLIVHWLVQHSFVHSLTHSFVHSLTHSFVHSSTHSLVHSLNHSFDHSLVEFSCYSSFIRLFTRLIHLFDSFICYPILTATEIERRLKSGTSKFTERLSIHLPRERTRSSSPAGLGGSSHNLTSRRRSAKTPRRRHARHHTDLLRFAGDKSPSHRSFDKLLFSSKKDLRRVRKKRRSPREKSRSGKSQKFSIHSAKALKYQWKRRLNFQTRSSTKRI